MANPGAALILVKDSDCGDIVPKLRDKQHSRFESVTGDFLSPHFGISDYQARVLFTVEFEDIFSRKDVLNRLVKFIRTKGKSIPAKEEE